MILTVHVKPGSSQTRVVAWLDSGTVVIALTAPPVDGKANDALIRFLADTLDIPKTFVTIKRGQSSRVKHIELPPNTDLTPLR